MYIYELTNWPCFQWDQHRISEVLLLVRHQQGRLTGSMESIGFHLREQTVLQALTQDIVKSSEIEGEILDSSQVRSSVARQLGIEQAALGPIDRNIDGVVKMVLDATQNFDKPLTKERLFDWHKSLFSEGRSGLKKITIGEWRKGPVYVVSRQMGKEKIHFEAPQAGKVDGEMESFLKWINEERSIDLVLKSALAHLWFVTIHPFEDGNGRIGRAIQASLGVFEIVLNKMRVWEVVADVSLNERQRKMLNRLLDGFEGKLTSSKWAKTAKCSQDTAHRDIMDLIEKGILVKNAEGGRSSSYSLSVQTLRK